MNEVKAKRLLYIAIEYRSKMTILHPSIAICEGQFGNTLTIYNRTAGDDNGSSDNICLFRCWEGIQSTYTHTHTHVQKSYTHSTLEINPNSTSLNSHFFKEIV